MEVRKSVPVIPELPKVLDNEQIHVYAPLASTTAHGIAQFSAEFFEVTTGLVKIATSLIKKLEYVRKSIDDSASNELDEFGRNPLFASIPDAGFDNLMAAIKSISGDIEAYRKRLKDIEDVQKNMDDDVDSLYGRLGTAETNIGTNAKDINDLGGALQTHVGNTQTAFELQDGRITDNANDIESIRSHDIGDMSAFGYRSVANTLLCLEEASMGNADDIANLSAKVEGIARSFVVRNFTRFKNYINGSEISGLPSLFDLKNGDNIYITESSVPDFWFEINTNPAAEDIEVIEYNGELVELVAKDVLGDTVGLFHSLETKYIEGEQLPEVDADDEGKFLRVANGQWKAAYVPRAEEATF